MEPESRPEMTRPSHTALFATKDRNPRFGSILMVLGALVIVLAGMRAASGIITPFLVSVFLATLAGPMVFWLHRHRVPKVLAVLVVIGSIFGCLTLVGGIAIGSLEDFNKNLPSYQEQLEGQIEELAGSATKLLGEFGIATAAADIWSFLDLGTAAGLARSTLLQIGNIVTKAFLVILMTLFVLFEAFRMPSKLGQALGHTEKTWSGFRTFARSVQKYLVVKTASSLATGLAAGLWVWILGVDYPVFWGLLAFLFNYVPNIGSFVAAVPAVLMAIVQYGGGTGLVVAIGYFVINIVIGGVIEPNFMGDSVGLSPLVVFMSLIFWGWVLGGVGMLLSTPLTISVKIAMENYPDTRWIATLVESGKA